IRWCFRRRANPREQAVQQGMSRASAVFLAKVKEVMAEADSGMVSLGDQVGRAQCAPKARPRARRRCPRHFRAKGSGMRLGALSHCGPVDYTLSKFYFAQRGLLSHEILYRGQSRFVVAQEQLTLDLDCWLLDTGWSRVLHDLGCARCE